MVSAQAVFNYLKQKGLSKIHLDELTEKLGIPDDRYTFGPNSVRKYSKEQLLLLGPYIILHQDLKQLMGDFASLNLQSEGSLSGIPASRSRPSTADTLIDPSPSLPYTLVDTKALWNTAYYRLIRSPSNMMSVKVKYITKDPKEIPNLVVIQIGYSDEEWGVHAWLIDFEMMDKNSLTSQLQYLMSTKTVVVHDGRMEAFMLKHHLKVGFSKVIDTQIAYEMINGVPFAGLSTFLKGYGLNHSSKTQIHSAIHHGINVFKKPFTPSALKSAADDVLLLHTAILAFIAEESKRKVKLEVIMDASSRGLESISYPDLGRRMAFKVDQNFKLVSMSLLPSNADTGVEEVSVDFSLKELLDVLPESLGKCLSEKDLHQARDLILDIGRPPCLYYQKGREFLKENVIDPETLASVVKNLTFGSDNRAIMEASLHRISAMKSLDGAIFGLTIRFGRSIQGNASIFMDLLHSEKSILIIGPPGTGKSSLIRDMIRILAENENHVIVVDTSNELCGNGMKVHSSVGLARRMMVPSLDKQQHVMIEAVQNHTPDIVVIDEVGRKQEVTAAGTIRRRGVRLMATAHGTFEDLIKNPELKGLLGGFERVILSDKEAERGSDGVLSKVKTQRAGDPVFDTIIQLEKNNVGRIKVFHHVASIVDKILQRESFTIEERWFGPNREVMVALKREGKTIDVHV